MCEQEMLLCGGHRVDQEQMLTRCRGGMYEQKPLLRRGDRMREQKPQFRTGSGMREQQVLTRCCD
jgi:hypothetical protein